MTLLILKSKKFKIDLIFNLSISYPIKLLIFSKFKTIFFSSIFDGYSSIISHIISPSQESFINKAALFKA